MSNSKSIHIVVSPFESQDDISLRNEISKKLDISNSDIKSYKISKKSIDARNSKVKFNLWIDVILVGNDEIDEEPFTPNLKDVKNNEPVFIIGSGPAGLFFALTIIEKGYKPIIIEQGKSVEDRKKDISILNKSGELNTTSNWCFGEGGAGTYTDGKLYTRSNKRGDINKVLNYLVYHGANNEILYESHPHIGTDKLPNIISNIRKTITDCGGEFCFEKKLTNIIIENDSIKSIVLNENETISTSKLVLATGNSARDIYELLNSKNIEMSFKPFALGVRVEHPQELINESQYGKDKNNEYLPPATYKLVTQVKNKGVFSFCMCPGGIIVPSSTNKNELVVNGMSNSRRNSKYANSGIVVEIGLDNIKDFSQYNELAGLYFQKNIEEECYKFGGGNYVAPAQRIADFIRNKPSTTLPKSSYNPGLSSFNLNDIFKADLSFYLKNALIEFNNKIKGFTSSEAVMVAVESRTSSPIQILRNKETFEHVKIKGLYPIGEGSGYAGGITSSAIDGINCAEIFS